MALIACAVRCAIAMIVSIGLTPDEVRECFDFYFDAFPAVRVEIG